MLPKVVNNNIFIGCLVPFCASFKAEQYGERIIIMEIENWKVISKVMSI